MNVSINITKGFKRQAKPLLKKYVSLKAELLELQVNLSENPTMGVQTGEDIYKIRLKVKSKGKGKSGGLRVITFVETIIITDVINEDESAFSVNLIAIYDKSDTESLSISEIESLIKEIDEEV